MSVAVLTCTFVFCLGLCVGSFLNVCIYRLPREMSLVWPGSHCPTCNEPVAWCDNIPVVSWVSLRGLCRRCGVLISPRYLLVEVLTGLVFLWIYAGHRAASSGTPLAHWPTLGAYSVLAAALIVASFVDIERFVIPDEISIGGMYVGPVLCAIWPDGIEHDELLTRWLLHAVGAEGSAHLTGLAASVVGLAIGAAVVFAAGEFGRALFRKEAMGFGDVKLMGMVGAFVGWQQVVLAFFIACMFGAVIGLARLIARRDTHIPFGPYLAAGSLAVMLHGETLFRVLRDFPFTVRSWFG